MNELSLVGRRVLFVAPRFFGYDDDISAELMRRGATVVRIYDRPYVTPIMTAITKVAPSVIAQMALAQYRRIIEVEESFDLVLVINGQTLNSTCLTEIRRHSPRARCVLYLWDSLDNRQSIIPNLRHYDSVLGFDRLDARRYGFGYRSLFFGPMFEEVKPDDSEPTLNYDISFIGTAHSDRAPIVHAIDTALDSNVRRFWYLFLQAPWVRRYYALRSLNFSRVPPARFHYQPMEKADVGRVFRHSRAILDIEHLRQRGLTMRTFETIGSGKKLVTTNPNVMDEEFYHSDRVLVLDRARPLIKETFLASSAPPLSPTLRSRYSLAGWLSEVLNGSVP